MDLRAHLLELVGLAIGDELDGARLTAVSSELGLRYTFSAGAQSVAVEVALASETPRFAAREGQLAWSYRSDGDAALGLRLCRLLAGRSAARQAAVLAAIAENATGAAPRIREVRAEGILEPAGELLTLSPYVGCLIGCRFCYAQGRLHGVRRLEQLPEVPWGSWVDVRIDAAEALARDLATAPPLPVKFCPIVSDPYQAVEERYRLTRACLEVLRDERPGRPVLVLTRSRLIERDLDVLRAMPHAWAGLSLPTVDEVVLRRFEPRAAPAADRLAALAALKAAGVRTFAIVQPLLPGPVDAFADALAAAAGSVRIDVLHGVEGAAADFDAFPEAAGDPWQRRQAAALAAALTDRGVPLWAGELPPDLSPKPRV